MIKIEKQNRFPFIHEYSMRFPITNETIFVYEDKIFTNYEPPYDIVEHEKYHLARQKKIGADKWINKYLADKEFRLNEELLAYKYQLKRVKELTNNDREELFNVKHECAINISSPLYGSIITYNEAMNEFNKHLKTINGGKRK